MQGDNRSLDCWTERDQNWTLAGALGATAFFVFAVAGLGLLFTFAGPQNVCLGEQPEESEAEFWFAPPPGPTKSRGQQLFERDFSKFESIFNGVDGLGPVFNEVSCVGCHHQAATGGGGGLKHNVDIITVSDRSLFLSVSSLRQIHPGFVGDDGILIPSLVLHRYASDDKYADYRKGILGKSWIKKESDEKLYQEIVERKPIRTLKPDRDIQLIHSQRNTPALFGSGLIDQVPVEVMYQQAAAEKRFGVGGRVSQVRKGRVGKFGWRAQLPTLKEFVLSACANELGLEVEGHSQPPNPLAQAPRVTALELSSSDTDAMIEYVSSISSPSLGIPGGQSPRNLRGFELFKEVGCAECHVQNMGPAENIFSDLLLHDMGPGLGDPVAATREIETVTRSNPDGTGTRRFFDEPKIVTMYYTGSIAVPQVTEEPNSDPFTDVFERFAETNRDPKNEWRTPPLWGCADSGPYLHDGRSPTLHDAIVKHAGQARRVRLNYLRLKKSEQRDLLAFLDGLKSPSAP